MSESRTSQKYDLILNAAARVFSEKGYSVASMNEIAAAAPVSKATLYSYFKDKKELFSEMIRSRCRKLSEAIGQALESDADLYVGLRTIAQQFHALTQSQEAICVHSLIIAENKQFPELAEAFYASVDMNIESLSRYLAAVAAESDLTFKNTRLAAMMFLNMLKGECFSRRLLGMPVSLSEQERQELVDEAIHVFIQGHLTVS